MLQGMGGTSQSAQITLPSAEKLPTVTTIFAVTNIGFGLAIFALRPLPSSYASQEKGLIFKDAVEPKSKQLLTKTRKSPVCVSGRL